ncbi:MAG TPA: CDP-alcohol phosphatidyltransferase family protein [Candidatus Saccharimonadales bacterium]|nr:CDP-alcohol phosphatidyltransferase family protein [Candidatus Saccharimonadales bacterium]
MNLHRIEGKPEWADVKPASRNVWQKVAARSDGIITIGNYFSLLGLLSVPFGLKLILDGRYVAGVIILLLGRLCDLLDGFLADKTGTKSPLGEKIDAVFDKLSTGVAVIVLALSGLVPWWVIVLLVLPHVITTVLATATYLKGSIMHPSLPGKLSMAAGWLTMLAFVLTYAFSGFPQKLATTGAYVLLAMTVAISLVAVIGYVREYRQIKKAA